MADRTNELTKTDNNCPNSVISLLISLTYIVAILNYKSKIQLYIGEPASGVVAMGGRAI